MSSQWSFTIDDASPVFQYSPYADGFGLQNGWQTWYTGTGFNTAGGESPTGDSFHLTSLPGASVTLSFFGTGVSLYGTANCTYEITLDNTLTAIGSPPSGTLFSQEDLTPEIHNVTLTAKPDANSTQQLAFDRANITSTVNGSVSSPQTVVYDNQNTSVIAYTGNWTANATNALIPSSQNPSPYHKTTSQGASATLVFTGRAVAVYGVNNWGYWQYLVTLDGQQSVLNASTYWLVPNVLLFYQDGLDETKTHNLNITNGADDPFSLNSITVYQFNATNTTSSTNGTSSSPSKDVVQKSRNVGVIVGPIIAVVVVLVLATFALFWCRKRRRTGAPINPFWISGAPNDDSVTPYINQRQPNGLISQSGTSAVTTGGIPYSYTHLHSEKNRLIRDGIGTSPSPTSQTARTELNGDLQRKSRRNIDAPTAPSSPNGSPAPTASGRSPRNNGETSPGATGPLPSPMSTHTHRIPQPSEADMERILEMLAERIDRRSTGHDPLAPPPEYPQ